MTPWEVLEIAPTSDKRAIKRAYAAKLKTLVLDEQPEKFQRLKSAFDLALTLSKNDSLIEDDLSTPIDIIADPSQLFDQVENDYESHYKHSAFPAFRSPDSFSDSLQHVLDDDNYFEDLATWKELTVSISNWSIDEYMRNTYTIQLFLVENYRCLGKEIIRFLFQTFDLTELTDHIGQERFVSSDFLYLKKDIYNVPPFSFQIAMNIPKEQRKKYFHLRYDIYQLIANKQGFIMNIEAKISDCTELFENDSELWNLQMIDLLDKTNGLLDTNETKDLFKSLLERTRTMNNNPTTAFLNNYFILLTETHTGEVIFDWHKEQLTLPEEVFILLLGSIFFHSDQYIPAFNLWKQLDLSRRIALQKQFKMISPHLPKNEKVEYRRIEKEIRSVLKPRTGISSEYFKKGFIFLLSGALILLFLVKFISSAPRIPEPKPDDPLEKISTIHSMQQKIREAQKATYTMNNNPLEEQFTHYFYSSNDPEGKQLFIDKYADTKPIKELLQQYVDQDTFKLTNFFAFSYTSNTISDPENHLIAVYYEEELLAILKLDKEQSTIRAIYGATWEQLPDDQFQQLHQSVLINPESSTTIFLKKFLFSDNKQQNLLEYTDYLSENMKLVIANKLDEPISEKLSTGYLYLVPQPKIKFIVSDQNQEDEEKLILTFDEHGRLDHVFGPHWEEVEEEMIHYSNRTAFKNIPTLIKEPD